MNIKTQDIKCAYCDAYLFEEDDIVYCPECGAPHHRECYNKINECALKEYHGTDKEYKKLEITVEKSPSTDFNNKCSICGEEFDKNLNKCPKCSAPNFDSNPTFAQFDFLGGVPEDFDIGDGVTAKEARQFVFTNTQRYIPKFAHLNDNNKTSWNWIAFLFPAPWLFSRKQNKNGIIIGILTIIATLFSFPFMLSLNNFGITDFTNNAEYLQYIIEAISKMHISVVISFFISFFMNLIIRIYMGIKADYMYKIYTINSIKKIKTDSDNYTYDIHKKGGVNLILFMLSYMALNYIPNIIFMIIN